MTDTPNPQVRSLWTRRRWWFVSGAAAIVVAVVAVTVVLTIGDKKDSEAGLDEFLAAWHAGNLKKVSYSGTSSTDAAQQYATIVGELAQTPPRLSTKKVDESGSSAKATVTVEWNLSGAFWRYDTEIELAKSSDTWLVKWAPSVVHPKLRDGDRLLVNQTASGRGQITDAAGEPIVTARDVVRIGVVPKEVTDPNALAQQLGAALAPDGVDTSGLPAQLQAASPDQFVEVVTLRKERYEEIKPQIYDLPGTRFHDDELALAPTREFARAVLGTVGDATKEDLEKNPGKYQVGDQVGKGGVQQRYNDRLSGKPAMRVDIERGSETIELTTLRADPGKNVQLALDQRIQTAADAALAGESRNSSMVAIRISDGSVVAAANGPDAPGYNSAFEATVAPGSTFKVVSGLGLLEAGLSPDDVVSCPEYAHVDGKSFNNDNHFVLGDVPFHVAFSRSCNTAFVGQSEKLGDSGLADAAAQLGIGHKYDVGLDAYTGSVERGGSNADKAAASFGQGKTQVSPLAMASAVAAVAKGQWQQPKIVLDPAPKAADPIPAPDGAKLEQLRTMMREVVTEGTATSLNDLAQPVSGKTGTAEYGTDNPPRSHGWFVGFQGDLAFAVFVEDGGSSQPAVAIAKSFLTAVQ